MYSALIKRYGLVSDQVDAKELNVILEQLHKALDNTSSGDAVEFGCYVGTTSLYLERVLSAEAKQSRRLFVYDSFAGLPAKNHKDASPAGEAFKTGKLKASKQTLIRYFKQAGLRLPVIKVGWFNELAKNDVPKQVAFAFLDGDYYDSIWSSLLLIEMNLVPGAIIVVDDYQSEALPGARLAVDEWLARRPDYALRVVSSLAVITTPKS